MKAVILAGGYGTRMSEVTNSIPKPMVEIGGKPILWHIMNIYSHYGVNEFIICGGYKQYVIKEYFFNYLYHNSDLTIDLANGDIKVINNDMPEWKVTIVDTGLDTMTGGRIKRIQEYVGDESFFLTYGDGVSDVDIGQLVKFHKTHGKILTVTGVRPPGRFGEMMSAPDGKILEFNEKPQATDGRINGGYFVASPKIFDYLGDREDLVFEQEPIRQLVKDEQLMTFEHNGFWQPMDTSREYQLLNELYEKGDAPWIR